MVAIGVAPVSSPLLHSYLRDRSQRVRIEDVAADVFVFSKGSTPGSVLIFFLIVCSILLLMLVCSTVLIITKFILAMAILMW